MIFNPLTYHNVALKCPPSSYKHVWWSDGSFKMGENSGTRAQNYGTLTLPKNISFFVGFKKQHGKKEMKNEWSNQHWLVITSIPHFVRSVFARHLYQDLLLNAILHINKAKHTSVYRASIIMANTYKIVASLQIPIVALSIHREHPKNASSIAHKHLTDITKKALYCITYPLHFPEFVSFKPEALHLTHG